jgi:hypothetical protein
MIFLVVSITSVCENNLPEKISNAKMNSIKRVDFFMNKSIFDQRINKSNNYLITNAFEKYLFPEEENPIDTFNDVVQFETFWLPRKLGNFLLNDRMKQLIQW